MLVEVTVSMLDSLVSRSGWGQGFGCLDVVSMDMNRRYHVVERMTSPRGDYELVVVGSFDGIRDAFAEVDFRTGYRMDYAPEGWFSDYEIWHVNHMRYWLRTGDSKFLDYVNEFPRWLYAVEVDGERIISFDAEDWQHTMDVYGYGRELSTPVVKAWRFLYNDMLGWASEDWAAYVSVVVVEVF